MGVTIDNLQIEIQSSSTNAAKGIDALATSLEKLKKNGSFKTVSNNLNNLSAALNNLPNVHKSSNALRTLANSIEKLKGVGSVASLSNSLKKLPEALKAIEKINIGRIAPQIQEIVGAIAPLSAVKSGGFGSIVNGMKNLAKVTESLDDETIQAFAKKIKLLNEELGPFAEKMATVKSAFGAINSKARSAASGVKEFGEGVNTSTLNLSSFLEVARTAVDMVQNLIQTLSAFIAEAIEWDGIAARFGRGFAGQASETYAWIQRLNDEMGINIQEFMKYSSVYSTMLTGFGVATEDAGKMALGYMELTYDIWAGYNDVYGSLEETAEAVKSAIAGEVEPVRRAGFTIVEATLAQTAANHGLEISLANATEAQKSYLRYLTLVDQAHAQSLVGTYAKELNTAEGLMRTFAQQLKSLTQAFGSLFLPILVRVMPWLQAFVELLTEGVHWLAGLLGVEIQKVDFSGYESGAGAIENVADSAGTAADALGSATKAAKELKNATLGIDELNVISPPSASGSGGASGGTGGAGSNGFAGLDIDSLWDETIFDTIQSDVDAIKEKLKGWMPVIATVAASLAGLRLVKLLNDIKAIEKITIFGGLIKKFSVFVSAFVSLAKEGGMIATLAAAFPKLSRALATFTGNLGAFFALAKEGGVIGALSAAFPKLSSAISAVGGAVAGIGAPVWAAIAVAVTLVGSAIYFVTKNWDELKQAVKNFFAENISPKLEEIGKHFEKIKEALGPVWDDILKPIFDFVANIDWGSITSAIGKFFETIGWYVTTMSTLVAGGAINAIVQFVEGLVQGISGGIQMIRGIVDFWIALFTGGDLLAPIQKIGDGILNIFVGLYDSTIGVIVEFVKGIIGWFEEMWDVLVGHSIVPDTVNSIVAWFTSLPSKVFGAIENFAKGIVDRFKNLWNSLKSWWDNKSPLKEYTPSIGSIKDKLSSAWTSAKNWWNEKKSALKSYTPSIGSIYEKVKERWDSARTWWNDKKSSMKSYTPSIGSIYEKVKERWDNARSWWNSKKSAMSSYTPSIGSITDKVKSAWNSAKSWWSKNAKLSTKLDIKVPTIKVKWDTATAFGKSFKYPTGFSLKFAANGGIFDQGSLIWAGERGPEVMATAAGGKTGVMNVQQMQDAVYEGVYAAVSAAMRGMSGGGTQAVNVYLDGRQITSTVEQRQHERGASIMGNEVYSY